MDQISDIMSDCRRNRTSGTAMENVQYVVWVVDKYGETSVPHRGYPQTQTLAGYNEAQKLFE